MDTITRGAAEPLHCPIDGWEALQQLQCSSWQQIWSARRTDGSVAEGLLRVISIPAYVGEAEALRSGGFSDERIEKHIADCASRCMHDAEALMTAGSSHMPEIKAVKLMQGSGGEYRLYVLTGYYPTFTRYYEGRKISRGTLISLCCDLCDAIEDYSSVGMVHGAVQLENVYVDSDGRCLLGNPLFKPTLYSRILDPDDTRLLRFIAPEITRGEDYDKRSDICSLGLTMYFKFNGNRLPFVESGRDKVTREEVDTAIVRRLDGEMLPPPSRADEELSAIILRACAPDKNDRYSTTAELRDELVAYADRAGIELTYGDLSPELLRGALDLDVNENTEAMPGDTEQTDRRAESAGELSFAAIIGTDEDDSVSDGSADSRSEDRSADGAGDTEGTEKGSAGGYFDDHGNFILVELANGDDTDTGEGVDSEGERRETDEHEGTDGAVAPDNSETAADPSETEKEGGRKRAFPLLPISLITLGVIAVLLALIFCMQRFNLFGSDQELPETSAVTTSAPPVTTELPAGSVRMPDLTGKTRDEAESELARAGYRGELVIYGSYSYTAEENTVIEQFPAKNITFQAEDTVELTVSLGRAPDALPDVTALKEKDALTRLASLGYRVTALSAYSDVAAEGTVDMQSVAPGTKTESGTDMFIVISKGPRPTDYVEIDSLSLGAGNLTLEPDGTAALTVTVNPENATERDFWWQSDDTSKVEVDQSGKVTAKAASGRAVITVMSADGVHSAKRTVVIRAGAAAVTTSRVNTPSNAGAQETESAVVRWSDWSETATPGSESKTQYSSRTKTVKTQTGSPISGWEVDSSLTAYGDWSEWGAWGDMPVSESDTVKVETRTVYKTRARSGWVTGGAPAGAEDVKERTVYMYCEIVDGVPGEWQGPVTEVPQAPEGKHYVSYDTVQSNYVPAGTEWSDWSAEAVSVSDTLDVMTNTQYRSCTRSVTYTCYTWSAWSEWSDSVISPSANTEVRTRKLYRYKISG